MKENTCEIHVISNTHWDIEYLWSLNETRILLCDMMDGLLDVFKDPDYKHFHLDAQVFPIEEYLKIRPDKKERIVELITTGKLLIGPWYTLPEEFLASGEALIRNLLIGHKKAQRLGHVMKVGYNIFSFGQISQLPQIYRGFGIDYIIFKRGVNETIAPRTEFIWQAPDGTRAFATRIGLYARMNFSVFVYIPTVVGRFCDPQGWDQINGTMFNLCDGDSEHTVHEMVNTQLELDPEKVTPAVEAFRDELTRESTTNCLLACDGFDQGHAYRQLTDIIKEANARCDDIKLVHGSLEDYVAKVKGLYPDDLQVLKGEMRHVSRKQYIYPAILSARMPLKLINARAQQCLEKWAEPAAVFAALAGAEYPALPLQEAWEGILINQHHDGITGLHLDRVFLATMERYRQSIDISQTVTKRSLRHIATQIDVPDAAPDEVLLVVFNSLPYPRTGPVEVDVDFFWDTDVESLKVCDMDGREMLCRKLYANDVRLVMERYYWFPLDEKNKWRVRVVFEARDIPPMGYKTFRVKPLKEDFRAQGSQLCGTNAMENAHLRVHISDNGTLEITEKTSGRIYRNLHYFVDDGDVGAGTPRVAPTHDQTVCSLGFAHAIALVSDNALATTFRVAVQMKLPAEVVAEKIYYGEKTGSETSVFARSQRTVDYEIVSYITLKKDSRTVDIRTELDNTAKDHRLRVVFPTHLSDATHAYAEGQFDVVPRPIAGQEPIEAWPFEQCGDPNEHVHPKDLFVDVNDGANGLAIVAPGIPAYEVSDDPERRITLTLLRAVKVCGNVKSSTHLIQPLAQCPGRHIFEYSICPHQGSWQDANLFRTAAATVVPIRVAQVRKPRGPLPSEHSFIQVEPSAVVVSALKKSEETDAYVLRLWNPTAKEVAAKVTCGFELQACQCLDLEENPGAPLDTKKNSFSLPMPPHKIVTVALTGAWVCG